MKKYSVLKKQLLKDKIVKKVYDDLGSEFKVIALFIKKRLEKGLTQQELARRIGTKQSAIARFESGTYNPTIDFLNKVALGLNTRIKISIDFK
ncbi:MAG: helix-turn-helix transcriptional regulator [Patescibacteria group bacterium]